MSTPLTLERACRELTGVGADIETAGGVDVVSPYDLGAILLEVAIAQGLRTYGETERLYLVRDGRDPQPFPRPKLGDWARAYAVELLEGVSAQMKRGSASRFRLRDTADLLRRRAPGHTRYVWTLVSRIVDFLPELTEDEYTAFLRAAAERRAAKRRERRQALTQEQRNAKRREAYAAVAENAAPRVKRWLAKLEPGRYTTSELWASWRAFVDAHRDALAERAPEMLRLGRNRFLAIVNEVCPIQTGHKKVRYIEIQEAEVFTESELMERTAEKLADKLLARMDAESAKTGVQGEAQATGTDGARVIALAERRASRS